MAIISALRGVTVQVHMGGQSCTEYADDDDSSHQHETQNRVSKYIEAKSGQQFAIRIDVDKAYEYTVQPLCVRLFIDGSKMASSILTPELLLNRPCTVFTGATFQESEGMKLRPFIFSALTIVEEQPGSPLASKVDSLGEIVVKCWRMHVGHCDPDVKEFTCAGKPDIGTLSEKSLKGQAFSHSTSLGLPVATVTPPRNVYRCEHFDPLEKPFGTFTFKYRSREALKDLHILPRSPTPTPLEERLVDDLTREELRQLVRQLKNRLETAERIKPENKRSRNASGDENSDSDVKNVSPRQKKTSRLSTGPGNSATDEGNYRPD